MKINPIYIGIGLLVILMLAINGNSGIGTQSIFEDSQFCFKEQITSNKGDLISWIDINSWLVVNKEPYGREPNTLLSYSSSSCQEALGSNPNLKNIRTLTGSEERFQKLSFDTTLTGNIYFYILPSETIFVCKNNIEGGAIVIQYSPNFNIPEGSNLDFSSCNTFISNEELLNEINLWSQGIISNNQLLETITLWVES